jgi:hypothetical protein
VGEAPCLHPSVPDLEVALRRARQDVDTTSVLTGLIAGSRFPSDDGEFVGGVLIPELCLLAINFERGYTAGR